MRNPAYLDDGNYLVKLRHRNHDLADLNGFTGDGKRVTVLKSWGNQENHSLSFNISETLRIYRNVFIFDIRKLT